MSHNILTFVTSGHAAGMPWGDSLDWALVISILLCALTLVCIAISLFLYRGREAEATALSLGCVGLLLAPVALLPISNFAILRYTKQQAFCASCHTVMQPYVDDMHRANGRTMAARHFQNRFANATECYSCHVSPGMYGMFEAKLTGLHEAYAYATGNYHLPLKMATPFSNQFCLRCHDGARKFMAEDSHLDANGKTAQDLISGATRCEECHGPGHQIASLAQTSVGARGSMP
jgi:hypothetical protein